MDEQEVVGEAQSQRLLFIPQGAKHNSSITGDRYIIWIFQIIVSREPESDDKRFTRTGGQVSLNMAAIGDLVFGVRGDRTGKYKAAYTLAFSPERNRAAWAAVGAAPLTRK